MHIQQKNLTSAFWKTSDLVTFHHKEVYPEKLQKIKTGYFSATHIL